MGKKLKKKKNSAHKVSRNKVSNKLTNYKYCKVHLRQSSFASITLQMNLHLAILPPILMDIW